MSAKFKKFSVIILLFILVGTAYFAGFLHGHGNLQFQKNFQPKIVNRELRQPRDIDFSLFWEVYDRLQQSFVGDIDPQKAVYGAIDGLVASTKDPYTVFLEPGLTKKFLADLNGEFEGIGTEIAIRDNILTVISPLEGSPAAKSGLKAKDRILKIDGQETNLLTLSESVDRIRGKSGTKVALTIYREGKDQPFEVNILREKIKVQSVRWTRQDGLVNVRITQFNEDTANLINKLAVELSARPASGVVLDLRNNPGGLLSSAVDVASYFMGDGQPVVYQENKSSEQTSYSAHSVDNQSLRQLPLVVLINGGSASASEILAGALSDSGRAKLVGEKSFGKGSVQDFHEFRNQASLKVTIAKWLTPHKKAINGEGIKPDIEVKLSEDDEKNGRDPQLDKAVALLKSNPS